MVTGFDGQGNGEMGFAHSRWAREDDVLMLGEKSRKLETAPDEESPACKAVMLGEMEEFHVECRPVVFPADDDILYVVIENFSLPRLGHYCITGDTHHL